jgi:glyoxylase-like metal-dependent hydrolase (beta-lactamase superfamily II)
VTVRVDHAVTSGTFSLDGQTFDVDNNIWVVGDDTECVVIDAPHSVDDILAAVGDRRVKGIVCTHAHDDHVRVAPALRERVAAPIHLHPGDRPLWELTHGGHRDVDAYLWDVDLSDGQTLKVAGMTLHVLHTPGHAPGAVCLYAADLGSVFTGDTLFHGGPGATGRSFSDRSTLEASIRRKLFTLPAETLVHPGHGEDTTIGQERARVAAAMIRKRAGRRLSGEEVTP